MAWKLVDVKCLECGYTREILGTYSQNCGVYIEEEELVCPECGANHERQSAVIGNPQHHKHQTWGTL